MLVKIKTGGWQLITTRRKVINDSLITQEIYDKLINKIFIELQDKEVTQSNIIDVLLPLNICNQTIARVVNDLIPTAKATGGSIASMIRYKMKPKKNDLLDELMNELEEF